MPNFTEKECLVLLSHFPLFGPRRLTMLKDFFKSWRAVLEASDKKINQSGLGEKVSADFCAWRADLKPENIFLTLEKENIKTVSIEEEGYPKILAQTYDPPFILFYKGELKNDEKSLAIVGSRKCTPYGIKIVEKTIPVLTRAGLTITSGLALGIDAVAHAETIKAGGRTIGVLGCGLDDKSFYPAQNKILMNKIIENGGLVLSELPPKSAPLKQNFPRRNRIISGLSSGVFVVEANLKSGSLITARLAMEENREVFTAPGSIFSPQSEGPNNLIKQGAHPVLSAADILEGLKIENSEPKEKISAPDWSGMSEAQRSILVNLSSEPMNINDLKRLVQLDISLINSTLTILEIKGIVKNAGGGNYILI